MLGFVGAAAFAQEQVIPLVMVGGEAEDRFTTVVRLVSASTSPVSGTAFFLTPGGLPLSVRVEGASPQIAPSLRFTVPVGGVARLELSGATTALDTGWMRVVPDGRAPVFATATLMRGSLPARVVSTAAFGASLPYQATSFYHDSLGAGVETSLMVVNPSPSPLNVELILSESGGTNRSIVTRLVPPNGALSSTASELFRSIVGVDELLGQVRITGNRVFAAAALHHNGPVFNPIPLSSGTLERYSFEGDVQGWRAGSSTQSRAIKSCVAAEESPFSGKFSLKCDVELECISNERSSGEIEVDLRTNPPDANSKAPFNLDGIRMMARVLPGGASGSPDFRNSWQLFAKDSEARQFTGTQSKLDAAWSQLELTPVKGDASGFDPAQVTTLGMRVACPAGSFVSYRGPVYFDFVVW